MGSAYEIYSAIHDNDEYDMIAEIDNSSDEDSDEDSNNVTGHALETKATVLRNLAHGFPYNKGGPAQEYWWTSDEISHMAQLLRTRNDQVRERTKRRPRVIRAQNYKGVSSRNTLLNWINSVRLGKRFAENSRHDRGAYIKHGQWSNHRQWEYVSEALTHEFHYWMAQEKINKELPDDKKHLAKYPLIQDLIFRNNEDFTGGLWSQFYKYWEPFIAELRLDFNLPLTISFDNFISAMKKVS